MSETLQVATTETLPPVATRNTKTVLGISGCAAIRWMRSERKMSTQQIKDALSALEIPEGKRKVQ